MHTLGVWTERGLFPRRTGVAHGWERSASTALNEVAVLIGHGLVHGRLLGPLHDRLFSALGIKIAIAIAIVSSASRAGQTQRAREPRATSSTQPLSARGQDGRRRGSKSVLLWLACGCLLATPRCCCRELRCTPAKVSLSRRTPSRDPFEAGSSLRRRGRSDLRRPLRSGRCPHPRSRGLRCSGRQGPRARGGDRIRRVRARHPNGHPAQRPRYARRHR
jgi:hypothetical protein